MLKLALTWVVLPEQVNTHSNATVVVLWVESDVGDVSYHGIQLVVHCRGFIKVSLENLQNKANQQIN